MKNTYNNEIYQKIVKRVKRIVIAVLICLPIILFVGYFTRNTITSNAGQIAIYVVIMLIAVLIEELLYKMQKNKKSEVEDVDVFK